MSLNQCPNCGFHWDEEKKARCSLCGAPRVVKPDGGFGACTLLGCKDPLHDYRLEFPVAALDQLVIDMLFIAQMERCKGDLNLSRTCEWYAKRATAALHGQEITSKEFPLHEDGSIDWGSRSTEQK